ncbi:hypothetical protein NC652_013815 [Populus alba x Populus x berolinensis]|uniref:Uncharacterized protein n=1 Tax=Populus alba x Populus x berolinensis TaxID=444605 RepID=A0AAD6QV94_9ROSI|nr:hypothetical protein NC652_013815 [Populus alba x Populus x berolinensis]KAJ6997315.1 hypothetical protein NC653_013784 [Populus alba x Populus x berolinensis]
MSSSHITIYSIVLEDTAKYIGYAPKDEPEAQDRHYFDLLVRVETFHPLLTSKAFGQNLFPSSLPPSNGVFCCS